MTTITEALAELKTIDKRIKKKMEFIGTHAMREARVKDNLEKDGGATVVLSREMQAVRDLEDRKITIRTAIQKKNLETPLVVNERTMLVAEWLHWKRDVAGTRQSYLNGLINGIASNRDIARNKKKNVKTEESDSPDDVILHLDELDLRKQSEDMEIFLGELDGKLSLVNATTQIDI